MFVSVCEVARRETVDEKEDDVTSGSRQAPPWM
jgi:hypothetical protein